jgi:hypothetical protein
MTVLTSERLDEILAEAIQGVQDADDYNYSRTEKCIVAHLYTAATGRTATWPSDSQADDIAFQPVLAAVCERLGLQSNLTSASTSSNQWWCLSEQADPSLAGEINARGLVVTVLTRALEAGHASD